MTIVIARGEMIAQMQKQGLTSMSFVELKTAQFTGWDWKYPRFEDLTWQPSGEQTYKQLMAVKTQNKATKDMSQYTLLARLAKGEDMSNVISGSLKFSNLKMVKESAKIVLNHRTKEYNEVINAWWF